MSLPEPPYKIQLWAWELVGEELFTGTVEGAVEHGRQLMLDLNARALLIFDSTGRELYSLHRSPKKP